MPNRFNFESYKPTFVGRPVEQMGQMMEKLDSNNRRLSQGYMGLEQALSSMPVNDADRYIIEDKKQQLQGAIDSTIDSDNYAVMEGILNKSIRGVMNDDLLLASIERNKTYEDFREKESRRFERGDISEEQFQHKYNTPFTPTVRDEKTGYVKRQLDLKHSPKKVDFDVVLPRILNSIAAESNTAEPTVKYLTKGQVLKASGQSTEGYSKEELNEDTSFLDYIKHNNVTYKGADKINQVLTQIMQTDPEIDAYLNDLEEIRGVDKASIIKGIVQPYVRAGAFTSTTGHYDKDSVTLRQLGMHGVKGGDDESESNKIYGEAFNLGLDDVVDDSKGNWINQHKFLKDDNPNTSIINSYVKQLFGEGTFNDLTVAEQQQVRDHMTQEFNKPAAKGLLNPIINRASDDKVKDESTKVFGSPIIEFKGDDMIKGAIPGGSIYDFATGKVYRSNTEKEALLREVIGEGKAATALYVGNLTQNSLLEVSTGETGISGSKVFNVGDRQLAVLTDSADITKNHVSLLSSSIVAMEQGVPVIFKGKGGYETVIHQTEDGYRLEKTKPGENSMQEIHIPKRKEGQSRDQWANEIKDLMNSYFFDQVHNNTREEKYDFNQSNPNEIAKGLDNIQ